MILWMGPTQFPRVRLVSCFCIRPTHVGPDHRVDLCSAMPMLNCRRAMQTKACRCMYWHDICLQRVLEVAFLSYAGNCWVLADNEELKPPAVIDSRTFGPLPVKNIMGRVIYYARKNDHGPVENSRPAMSADAAVLEAELDLDKLQAS
jgi:hypothetical protein